jgi:hypothetical protein
MSWEQAPPSRQIRQWLWPGFAVVALTAVAAFVMLIRSDGPTGTLAIGPTAEPPGDVSATPSVNPSDFVPTPLASPDGSSEDTGAGPLLPDGPDVTVVTADDQDLRSVNIATGDVRRSPVGTQIDPWTLFAVRGGVIANGADHVVRIASEDHQRVQLARNHAALPTFGDGSVWVLRSEPTLIRIRFACLSGRASCPPGPLASHSRGSHPTAGGCSRRPDRA